MPTNKLNDLDSKSWLKFQKSWFIHNPPPRKKGVLVHPAKFPETMAQEFIEFFTKKGQTVLDPMAGTGSTLIAALRAGRNSYGIELNPKYAEIAQNIIEEERIALGQQVESLTSKVVNADALNATDLGFPTVDYILTSPPYWDMLRARGAATQKKRRASTDLDVFYSDDPNDLGNVDDYEAFLAKLVEIYIGLKPLLREKAYLTIIVKNIKKGGKIYPLAWDIGRELGKTYTLKDEKIWCLPPSQKVWTQFGLRNIEAITEGDLVLTHLGSLQKVNQTMCRDYSGDMVKIKPSLLGKQVSITPEHEVLVIPRKQYFHKNGEGFRENSVRSISRGAIWLPARELHVGDLVAFPIPNAIIDLLELDVSTYLPQVMDWHQDEIFYYTRGRGKYGRGKLPKRIPINKDFMRLAGWFLSEGSATVSGVYIANISPDVQSEISQLFLSVFDAQSKVDKKGVWCRSRSIANLLANLFGKGAHNKKIPDFMLHLPLEKQKYLIQSLWEGDGHVRDNRVSYKTVSEELAIGIVYLSARAGAIPYFHRNPKWFSLNYRGRSMRAMQKVLGKKIAPPADFMRDQHWIHENTIWLPIREINIEKYEGKVFNLEIEEANTYMTENFIVHNCQDNQRLAPYGMNSAWVSNTFHHYCLQFRNE
jgi:DNA modification methylase/intein/homing endonuclease